MSITEAMDSTRGKLGEEDLRTTSGGNTANETNEVDIQEKEETEACAKENIVNKNS